MCFSLRILLKGLWRIGSSAKADRVCLYFGEVFFTDVKGPNKVNMLALNPSLPSQKPYPEDHGAMFHQYGFNLAKSNSMGLAAGSPVLV